MHPACLTITFAVNMEMKLLLKNLSLLLRAFHQLLRIVVVAETYIAYSYNIGASQKRERIDVQIVLLPQCIKNA